MTADEPDDGPPLTRHELQERLLGDTYVYAMRPPDEYAGETRVYTTCERNGAVRKFHADTKCPHFPGRSVKVYPVSYARDAWLMSPCGHCTTGGSE